MQYKPIPVREGGNKVKNNYITEVIPLRSESSESPCQAPYPWRSGIRRTAPEHLALKASSDDRNSTGWGWTSETRGMATPGSL